VTQFIARSIWPESTTLKKEAKEASPPEVVKVEGAFGDTQVSSFYRYAIDSTTVCSEFYRSALGVSKHKMTIARAANPNIEVFLPLIHRSHSRSHSHVSFSYLFSFPFLVLVPVPVLGLVSRSRSRSRSHSRSRSRFPFLVHILSSPFPFSFPFLVLVPVSRSRSRFSRCFPFPFQFIYFTVGPSWQ
jgi:hypothetical protein